MIGCYLFQRGEDTVALSPHVDRETVTGTRKLGVDEFSTAGVKAPDHEKAPKEISLESGAERLEKFMAENSNIEERCEFVQELIADLCSQGRDEEAYALIDDYAGHLREVGMYAFYSNTSHDKSQVINRLKRETFHDLFPGMLG